MELKLELDNGFVFDSQTFSAPREPSFSSTGSFSSSSTSSTADPFTPISGRSSPLHGDADYEMGYFHGLPYTCTPPPTAASGYFNLDTKPKDLDFNTPNGLRCPSSSFVGVSGFPLAEPAPMGYSTPQYPMYFPSLSDGATTPMLMAFTPTHSLGSDSVDNFADLWSADLSESPIAMFEPTRLFPRSHSPSRVTSNLNRRVYIEDAQQTSVNLQRQVMSNGPARGLSKRLKAGKAMLPTGVPVNTVGKPTQACNHPGCGKKFKRAEHLKRHMKTHYEAVEIITCPIPICKRQFKARPDNYRQHLSLHDRPGGKNSRVPFHPMAKVFLAEENRKLKERRTPSASALKRKATTTR